MRDPERGTPTPLRRTPGPSVRETVAGITAEFAAAGIESPAVEAERLIAAALDLPRSRLHTDGGRRLTAEEGLEVARRAARRLSGVPLQHLEGTVEFRRVVLVSDGRALIPRPETEQLIDRIAAWVARHGTVARGLEIGVGSGAIALSLLTEGLAERVVGLDVSEAALAQARENRAAAGLEGRLELRRCPPGIWPAVAREPAFDMIVSNPPYVRRGDLDQLAVEVREHEPRVALEGGGDGLAVIRRIVGGAGGALRAGAPLFLEIGAGQGPAVRELFASRGGWDEVRVERDLAGRERFVIARRATGV